MNRGRALAATAAALAVGAALWWAIPPATTRDPDAPAPGVVPPDGAATGGEAALDRAAWVVQGGAARVDDPAPVQAWASQQALQRALRAHFGGVDALDATEASRRSAALDADVRAAWQRGELLGDEALLLRLELARRGERDARAQAERIAAIEADMAADRERRLQAAQARRDPAFEAYKAREAAIVAEVMAMAAIPGGLDRDEYLRRRLQAERERTGG